VRTEYWGTPRFRYHRDKEELEKNSKGPLGRKKIKGALYLIKETVFLENRIIKFNKHSLLVNALKHED
jgi:hypothetical protein